MNNRLPLSEWAEHGTPIQRRHAANVARLKAAQSAQSPGLLLEGDPPAYPPLATQLATFAAAVGRFLRSGLRLVRLREYRRRRAICEACPLYDAAADRCRACGCNLSAKPWAASETCPKGHW